MNPQVIAFKILDEKKELLNDEIAMVRENYRDFLYGYI